MCFGTLLTLKAGAESGDLAAGHKVTIHVGGVAFAEVPEPLRKLGFQNMRALATRVPVVRCTIFDLDADCACSVLFSLSWVCGGLEC